MPNWVWLLIIIGQLLMVWGVKRRWRVLQPLWVQAVLSAGILAVIAIRDLVQGEPWSALLFTGLGLLILLGWWRGWSWFGKSRT